ncbi:MAG: hypothetical protein ACLFPQ_02110 [Candidatus Woesearchaeota archaeon]
MEKKACFPEFRKKVSDFLSQEDGKIMKQSAVALGAFMLSGMIASVKDVDGAFSHTNNMNAPSYDSGAGMISVQHNHHASHSTHSSGG